MLPFADREEAARKLLTKLHDMRGAHPLVLGIPRGAVPMAKLIATELGGDMDIILVKKIGHPLQPEFAVASVTEDGEIFPGLGAEKHGITKAELEEAALAQVENLRRRRRELTYLSSPIDPAGRIVVIVDDGIATGATMSAAVKSIKAKGAKRVIVATPVASEEAVRMLELEGAEIRVLAVPKFFGAVSFYYRSFPQIEK